jgi:hypothetical protein
MKAIVTNPRLRVPFRGNGGDRNQSWIGITLESDPVDQGLGDPWDIEWLQDEVLTSLMLDIPSGRLTFQNTPMGISVEFDFPDTDYQEPFLVLSAPEGVWNGKQGGLFGGLSAYGRFYFNNISKVVSGTYMLPEDEGQIDWRTYKLRQRAVEASMTDRDNDFEIVAGIAAVCKMSVEDRIDYQELLDGWYELIRQEVEEYPIQTISLDWILGLAPKDRLPEENEMVRQVLGIHQ